MTNLLDIESHLLFDRQTLLLALKKLAASLEKSVRWISISYADGKSVITAGTACAVVPAEGNWDEPIFVDAAWVRLSATLLANVDPVSLRVKNGRFYTNTYSQECRLCLPERADTKPSISAKSREKRISKAAAFLGDFRITEKAVEGLVNSIQSQRDPLWQPNETAMVSAVAKAWIQLAPLGVETTDLRKFLDDAIRYAFVGGKE
jgi:hypothetical protein